MTGIERLECLAEKLGGYACKNEEFFGFMLAPKLREIAADITQEVSDRSGYESDVLAWVEKNGGLDKLRDEAAWAESLSEILDEWADLLGFPEQKGDPGKITARVGSVLDGTWRRLMPEGMEWPRYEDGEPVRIGDHWHEDGYDWSITSVDSIEFAEDGVRFENEYADAFYRYGERVKRPAPPVLDADGEPCEVGDAVWWTRNLAGSFRIIRIEQDGKCAIRDDDHDEPCGMTVPSAELTHKRPVLDADGAEIRVGDTVYYVDGREQKVNTVARLTDGLVQFGRINEAGYVTYCEGACISPDQLTHRAPVLAGDGKPLEVGQTVYHIADGKEYTVEELFKNSAMVTPDGITGGRCRAEYLTHQRPESWERLEEDAKLGRCAYNKGHGYPACCIGCDGKPFDESCIEIMARDLVRRAKALAERGQ